MQAWLTTLYSPFTETHLEVALPRLATFRGLQMLTGPPHDSYEDYFAGAILKHDVLSELWASIRKAYVSEYHRTGVDHREAFP